MIKFISDIEHVNIIICVTFHYNETRLVFLKKILKEHTDFGNNVEVYVLTNTSKKKEVENIRSKTPQTSNTLYGGNFKLNIISCENLIHPYNLILEHKKILKNKFINQKYYTHFLHTEDDNLISGKNIIYWLKYRKILFDKKIIPSFFRYEYLKDKIYKSTDVGFKLIYFFVPKILFNEVIFMNMPNPSQSNYLLDSYLAKEMLENPNNKLHHFYFNFQGIRENADIGPIFSNVNKKFVSRNFVPFIKKENNYYIMPSSLINHIPANYVTNAASNLGKIPINNLFIKFPFSFYHLFRNIKYYPVVKFINLIINIFK